MADVKMKDLYYIDGKKERKAFITALRELEEEGFEVPEKTVNMRIARKALGNKNVDDENLAANDLRSAQTERVGATPAELSSVAKMRRANARTFTETTAVDMKDYKYWRDDEFSKRKKDLLGDDSFSFDDNDDDDEEEYDKVEPKTGASLFDELFSVDEPRKVETTQKPQSYVDMENLFQDKADADARADKIRKNTEMLREIAREQSLAKADAEKAKAVSTTKRKTSSSSKNQGVKPKTNKTATKTTTPKTTQQPRTRKYKKKIDADLKLAKKIVID